MKKNAAVKIHEPDTVWQPDNDIKHRLILAAILENNPIPTAYLLNYLANFYVGPLIKKIEADFHLTRPEWIVLFCLNQRSGLNAQQISEVTGRPKTSISAAVKQLQRKKLISRRTDTKDGRRQVLHIVDAGLEIYKSIIVDFIAKETAMLACLDHGERGTFIRLLEKIVENSGTWARSY